MIGQLVATPSVSSPDARFDQSNRGVVDLVAEWAEELGFSVRIEALPGESHKANLIATLGEGDDGLVLSGHTDTVPYDAERWTDDPFELTERDGKLFGLGTADMKGFFAAALHAISRFRPEELRRPITLLGTADEESTMDGARALAEAGERFGRYAIIGEPTGLRPIRKHKGVFYVQVTVGGKAGHASNPALGVNAIDGLERVLPALQAWRDAIGARYRDDEFEVPTPRYSDPNFFQINYYDVERETQRGVITEVPGSGPVTGVHIYQGELYALRNTLDGQAAGLYKANVVYMPDGETIDDSQSGWVLIDNTFNPNGRMDAENWRFSGSFADHQVMCIVDGVSLPRIYDVFDGVMYLFDNVESAGIPDRQPTPEYAHLVSVFDNRLVLGYRTKDIVLSSKTNPRDYTLGFGDQLLIGDEITDFQELPGESLGVFCRNSIKVLQKLEVPTSTAESPDFTFKAETFSRESGALPFTVERVLSKVLYADDRGVVDFASTDKYGDFEANAISKKVNSIYLFKKQDVTTSLVEKQVGQYRLFFNDGTSIWWCFKSDGELKGATYVEWPKPVLIACEGEDKNGAIVKYFASTDGYVYQMDKGTSFNGEEIETELFTSYFHYGTPRNWKTFRRMEFEITANRGTKFAVRPVYNYDSSKVPETQWWSPQTSGFSGIWGLDEWGEMIWGGAVIQTGVHYTRGVGRNMSIEMRTVSKYLEEHIIHNCIVDFEVNDQQQ